MKRTLFAIVLAAAFYGCTPSRIPDDRVLALLQGPVSEVIPSDEGEMIRFDRDGRMTYSAAVDMNLNPTGDETLFVYDPMDDGRTERIEMINRDSKMVNRRRCAVRREAENVEMHYFKIRMNTGEKVFTDLKRTFELRGGKLIRRQEPDSADIVYRYAKGSSLPCKEVVTDARGNVSVTEYEYPDTDSMGNWLTRLSIPEDAEPVLESRMIRYYE